MVHTNRLPAPPLDALQLLRTCYKLVHDDPYAPHVCGRLRNEGGAAVKHCLSHLWRAVVARIHLHNATCNTTNRSNRLR
jgi:hypothetical protein